MNFKLLLAATLPFLSLGVSAFDCTQFEAQVIGAAVVKEVNAEECRVQFYQFSHYNESQVCPLFVGEVLASEVTVSNNDCNRVGENVKLSGVLVQKNGESLIQLEE